MRNLKLFQLGNKDMEINYRSIGIIHTPFKNPKGMPIQPTGAKGIKGTIELNEVYIQGLKDLDGFSHLILIYHFHKATERKLLIQPFLEDENHGIFAIRAPKRPNPIGLSIVKLLNIKKNILEIENVDILNGTPLLDIKPYVPHFDIFDNVKSGWLETHKKRVKDFRSDGRFT